MLFSKKIICKIDNTTPIVIKALVISAPFEKIAAICISDTPKNKVGIIQRKSCIWIYFLKVGEANYKGDN